MTWLTQSKTLSATATTAHLHSDPRIGGVTPTQASITFTPFELYAAAARSSALSLINIAIQTPASDMMMKLIEPFVDDTSTDFAILPAANDLKDYVKSYLSGTLGTGLAYLKMAAEGYVWFDHFENLSGGNPVCKRKPDYVFTGPFTGVALMEAKGSRSGLLKAFDDTVLDGYQGQVEPHLGHPVGGQTAVRGYAIGAWMKSTTKAEMRIHHTALPATAPSGPGTSPPASSSIKRQNFASAFTLAHSPELGNILRQGPGYGRLPPQIPFLRFGWLGRTWVTGAFAPFRVWSNRLPMPRRIRLLEEIWPWYLPIREARLFAIEEQTAAMALRTFLGRESAEIERASQIEPIGEDLRAAARNTLDGVPGAVLPDGFALIGDSRRIKSFKWTVWDRDKGGFEPDEGDD